LAKSFALSAPLPREPAGFGATLAKQLYISDKHKQALKNKY